MKANLYKINEEITIETIREGLEEENYELIGEKKAHDTSFLAFISEKDRSSIEWISAFKRVYKSSNIGNNLGSIYNGILLVLRSDNTMYALTFGHAFHHIQRFCDPNFALDFAERELKGDKIDVKSSAFIQNIKIKGLVNLKTNSFALNEGGESYKFVTGTPIHDNLFGKKVECGYSIKFSKVFSVTGVNSLVSISKFIDLVEDVIRKSHVINSIPRVRYLSRKDTANVDLDEILLEQISSGMTEFDINLSAFDIIGSKIFFNSNDYNYSIYITGKKAQTIERLNAFERENVLAYIREHSKEIDELNSVKLQLVDEEGQIKEKALREVMFAVIEKDKKKYMLDDGLWGQFNRKFIEELENQLNAINENHVVLNPDGLTVGYTDEDDYIDRVTSVQGITKLHRKLLTINGTNVEIADLYVKERNELIAVKLGDVTKDLIYSFDQAIGSVNCIKNHKEFNLVDGLIDHGLKKRLAERIVSADFNSVLIGLEQKTYVATINSGTFKLTDLKSLLLKLKIVAWAKYLSDANTKFMLYIIAG